MLARIGEVEAARRPLHERDAEAFFEPAQGLADGRTAHTQSVTGGA
jgi:hypothetical protein